MELGTPVPQPKWYQRKRLVAGLVACACGLAVVAMCARESQQTSTQLVMKHLDEIPNGRAIKAELRKADAAFEARRGGKVMAAPTELYEYDSNCESYTGGTCSVQACHASRNATCARDWVRGHCLCPGGTCAGDDGACYPGNYQKVAENIEIKNVEFSTDTMYIPSGMNLVVNVDTHADDKGFATKFNLYKLPGLVSVGNAELPTFFVMSATYPDYVANVQHMGAVGLVITENLGSGWQDPEITSTVVCRTSGSKYQLGNMINQFGTMHWWYLSGLMTSSVASSIMTPGPEGQWKFVPDEASASTFPSCE